MNRGVKVAFLNRVYETQKRVKEKMDQSELSINVNASLSHEPKIRYTFANKKPFATHVTEEGSQEIESTVKMALSPQSISLKSDISEKVYEHSDNVSLNSQKVDGLSQPSLGKQNTIKEELEVQLKDFYWQPKVCPESEKDPIPTVCSFAYTDVYKDSIVDC